MISHKKHLLFFIAAILVFYQLSAQKGLYDARIAVKNFDCVNRSVIMQVQIRASTMANVFKLGDANYRFTYDPRQIKRPVLVTQDNFSNQAPALDRNYGPQNLSGSSEGETKAILSINCFYSGGAEGAKNVDTAWTTVSCVKFTLVNADNCINIQWNNGQNFPMTGMNEVIVTSVSPYEYTTTNVRSNETYININECFAQACDNKAPKVTKSSIIIDEDRTTQSCTQIIDPNFSDKHTVSVCTDPINGIATASVDNNRRELCITYTPDAHFNGKDSICLLVCDNAAMRLCDTVRIPITVNAVPDPPSVSVTTLVAQAGVQLDTCITIQDNDIGDSFRAISCYKSIGSVNMSVNNHKLCISYKSNNAFSGKDSICITVCDVSGLCQTVKIGVQVAPCADAAMPIMTCPADVEVSLGGNIVSDTDKFITSAAIADNCSHVVLNFRTPSATDDCSIRFVNQVNGFRNGSAFPVGNSELTFEAADFSGKTVICKVNVHVLPIKLLNNHTITTCTNEVVSVSAIGYTNTAYQWKGPRFAVNSSQLTFPLVSVAQQGVYTLTATLGQKCIVKDSISVSLKQAPIVEHDSYIMPVNEVFADNITHNDSLEANRPYVIKLKDNVASGKLMLDEKGQFSYQPQTGFAGVVGFTYQLCYTDCPDNCQTAVASIKVAENKRIGDRATNIITPNGDGVNDALTIEGFDPTSQGNVSEISIFSQWGEKVFSASPYMNDWKGTFSGQPLPVGTYYFIFKKDPNATPITSFVSIVK